MSLEGENTSDSEKQNAIGKPMSSAPVQEESDMTHEKMMELEPQPEASGERKPPEHRYHAWGMPMPLSGTDRVYPEHSNICLVRDVEENRWIGLPDHRQKVTLLVVSAMLALRWSKRT